MISAVLWAGGEMSMYLAKTECSGRIIGTVSMRGGERWFLNDDLMHDIS
jgi:hypothetical protein